MKFNSLLDHDLISAYKSTNFHVKTVPALILNVDKVSEGLKILLEDHQVDSAAFITAWNPYSESLSNEENIARNDQLKNELKLRSLKFLEGFGQDPLGQWPGEESFLILGVSLETSKKLGVKFKQNAIVWSDKDAVPKLLLLR